MVWTFPGHEPAVDHPVEMVIAFRRRFSKFMKTFVLTENNVLGKVTDYWWRIEYQKRGGIHVHMVVWCDPDKMPKDTQVCAEMPRFSDPRDPSKPHPDNQKWRDIISRYHKHGCRPVRCHQGPLGKKLRICKYGFPFAMNATERLDDQGTRTLYIRREPEDADVSSHILEIVMLWDGHANVQRVTNMGWEMYLAKYIAKSEAPSNIQLTRKKTGNNLTNVLFGRYSAVGSQQFFFFVLVFTSNKQPAASATTQPNDGKDSKSSSSEPESVLETDAAHSSAGPNKNTTEMPQGDPPKEKVPYSTILEEDSDVKRYLKLRTMNSLEAVTFSLGILQVCWGFSLDSGRIKYKQRILDFRLGWIKPGICFPAD